MAVAVTIKALLAAAEKLVDSITFDDSGINGRGGNGGLISRETTSAADKLRFEILRYRHEAETTKPENENAS